MSENEKIRYEIRFIIEGYEDYFFRREMVIKYDDADAAKAELAYIRRISEYKDHGHGWLRHRYDIEAWINTIPRSIPALNCPSTSTPELYMITEKRI